MDENGEPLPPPEEGELIEKVLEHRMGVKGATGIKTTCHYIEEHGDPNSVPITSETTEKKDSDSSTVQTTITLAEPERELQFLIKWKNFSYIHCSWESKESLIAEKARGIKKIENYLKREEEIKYW